MVTKYTRIRETKKSNKFNELFTKTLKKYERESITSKIFIAQTLNIELTIFKFFEEPTCCCDKNRFK